LNSARERREASGAGWANGRVGRKVGWAESEEKNFYIKNEIFLIYQGFGNLYKEI
jgi:hypothetical protein